VMVLPQKLKQQRHVDHNESGRHCRAVPVVNRYVGNLPPMPGVFPDYSAPVVRNAGAERELTMMRWGMPTASEVRRGARHQHPEYLVAALAWLAEAGEPMPGSLQQFRRICAGAQSGDQEKGRCLVCAH
jgi:putative SOS response-associated peptidase YedK